MDCPRCDTALATYALAGTDDVAVVCEDCGFAGVSASHRSEPTPVESWDAALGRFTDDPPPAVEVLDGGVRTASPEVPAEDVRAPTLEDVQSETPTVAAGVGRDGSGQAPDESEET
jgi:hypothetical protein